MTLHRESLGAGPDLVLLHGWGMSAAVWRPVLGGLAEQFRLHLIELPGHGFSAYDLAHGDLQDWVDACIAAAPGGASWLGWSLGGTIALAAALAAPQQVARLIVVAATPRFVRAPNWPYAMAPETLAGFARELNADRRGTLERFLALQTRGGEGARETLRVLKTAIRERPDPIPRALAAGLALLRDSDLRPQLGRLALPVLWILGERDTLVPQGLAAALQLLLPGARISVVPGAAHAPFLSHPEYCQRLLAEFVEVPHG